MKNFSGKKQPLARLLVLFNAPLYPPAMLSTTKNNTGQSKFRLSSCNPEWLFLTSFAGIAALTSALIVIAIRHWDYNFDDAFISYRYATHVAQGFGFRWNLDDPNPTEGSTTFLWIIILAFFRLLGSNVWITGKVLCTVFFALLLILVWLTTNPRQRPFLSLFAPAVLVAHPISVAHVVGGMETTFYSFVLTGMTSLLIWRRRIPKSIVWFSIVAVLALMTRPDSVIYSSVLALGWLVTTRDKATFLKQALAVGLVPALVFILVKYLYFGFWAPNSFFVKQHALSDLRGWPYVKEFLLASVVVGILPIVSVWAAALPGRKRIYLVMLLGVFCHFLYFATVQPTAGQGWRFLFPVLPSFLLIVGEHLHLMVVSRRSLERGEVVLPTLALAILIGLFFYSSVVLASDNHSGTLAQYYGDRVANVEIGKMLNGLSDDPSDVVLATGEAGAIPFFTEYHHIDLFGLNDNRIAHEGLDPDYVFGRNPDIIVLHIIQVRVEAGRVKMVFNPRGVTDIPSRPINDFIIGYHLLTDPRFVNYALLRTVQTVGWDDNYYIFARRDSPYFENLSSMTREYDVDAPFRRYELRYLAARD